ncbi:restriction endonuclease subunit S [Aggregatibacter actinomycetemcomitans]|uniref:restriction endonuclease subunit S n=3 Tax=Aggregatibacter actinomycetemcomitans TaxID=714 RepID=UPI00022AC591|nr:restriction endonuclease subunit S [Aggregatibacter actinomycetemcomitans]AEW76663.1 restriction modification system DNA specificity subunit [Aggregatibacter actinomycetemcomitans ANH9381]AHN71823.1 hypothetical protein CF65_01473 [Aggregatibacter actinomycetemcomitans HK1651]AMQ92757.1 restriction endonuclease [Aggregatibacter actinomycetemcomitans]KND84021.1 restriction endonuclease [Aggregatibacter actinomycetemcomitans serotype b str. SCC1398]KOE51874.1 restriction endonuclease [Aggrega
MNELQDCILGDLVEFQRGYDLPKDAFVKGEYPVQSSNGILGYHNEYKVKAPGITIGRSGTVGIPHLITKNFFPHNTALYVKDFKGNNVQYIYYLLKNLKLNEYKTGSGVPTMNRNHLHPLKIRAFTNLKTQQSIAAVLSALDKKIALNKQINARLEEMAKTLYDYWFVQFDFPDANGKPYKSSGGEMVFDETLKREIPKGWEVKSLGDWAEIKKGTLITEKTANTNGDIKVISAGLDFSYYHDVANRPKNTITISASGANAGFVNFWREPIFVCDCTTITNSVIGSTLYILNFLRIVQDFIYQQARGSAQPHVYPKDIEGLKIIVPPDFLLKRFSEFVENWNLKIVNSEKQNHQLTQLRDFLLPMLMNGQVAVAEE